LEGKATVVAITPRLGVSLLEEVPDELQTSAYGVVSRGWNGSVLYDATGLAYVVRKLETSPPLSLLRKLLAYTVYNPAVKARVSYDPPRRYGVEELREHLIRAVQADDDILTQWHSEDELLRGLRSAIGYAGLIAVIRVSEEPPSGDGDAAFS
jgi:hypothetical protein